MGNVSGVPGAGGPQKIPQAQPSQSQQQKILEALRFFQTLILALTAIASRGEKHVK